MSIEGQGHFFTIYFPGFVCFLLYKAKISGERLQDHWSSGLFLICIDFTAKYKINGRILINLIILYVEFYVSSSFIKNV